MRRQIKPFTVERKRNGRLVTPAEAPALVETQPLVEPPPPPAAPKWAAAEALFATPAETAAPERGAPAESAAPARRILPSLVDEPPQPPAHEPERQRQPRAGQARRGRPPKAREGRQGPPPVDTAMGNLFEFWTQEDEAGAPEPAAPAQTIAPIILRRRGRLERAELPRGARWKARLPRFAR